MHKPTGISTNMFSYMFIAFMIIHFNMDEPGRRRRTPLRERFISKTVCQLINIYADAPTHPSPEMRAHLR